jgi:DMSO/TMAO reductase YedYZ molybdopterin-dependent catalytic subunit
MLNQVSLTLPDRHFTVARHVEQHQSRTADALRAMVGSPFRVRDEMIRPAQPIVKSDRNGHTWILAQSPACPSCPLADITSRQKAHGMIDFARATGTVDRRRFLRGAAILGAAFATRPAWAGGTIKLNLPGGPDDRELTTAFPQKGQMILQRTRPPLLETPFDVFDKGIFTPNEQFFVRWHWAVIPEEVDVAAFRLAVRGHVNTPLSLSITDLLALPRVEITAVNQCSGNSRGLFQPRVPGGQWANGAMGNANWTGVRLRDVLDRAGVKAGAVAVRCNGMDEPVVDGAPDFTKSLAIDHARDGEVILAYQMNGEQLPLLNGFPLRLVVPGWYSTYWVKMLNDLEVLDAPDDTYWMTQAYRIPDTPSANVRPGETGFKTVPISRMVPRSFFTNAADGSIVQAGTALALRGIAFGGDCGVARVDLSTDGGRTWQPARLGTDAGKYSFRQWTAQVTAPMSGSLTMMVRCTNTDDVAQPAEPTWNQGGFMRNVIERVRFSVA